MEVLFNRNFFTREVSFFNILSRHWQPWRDVASAMMDDEIYEIQFLSVRLHDVTEKC